MGQSVSLSDIAGLMRSRGADTIIYKMLANNDNSKQQVYFGSDFDILRNIPTDDIYQDGYSKKMGARFKADVHLSWIDLEGHVEPATHSQLILYPKYPEVRLSGFVRGCSLAPGHLMQPPTPEEREYRLAHGLQRCLVLGIREDQVLAYSSDWGDALSLEGAARIEAGASRPFTTVFYEFREGSQPSAREKLLDRLSEIYHMGLIGSRRLDKDGNIIPYVAQNGAGFTLESFFGITPNGRSEPDFLDWELKAHSSGVVTLMTPEPDTGSYIQDLRAFLDSYATSRTDEKINFASIHRINEFNERSHLTMSLDGFDPVKGEIKKPEGGMVLKDQYDNVAAGWSFEKLLNHWKRKHTNTCFVSYRKQKLNGSPHYAYGPSVRLCKGAGVKNYLSALASSVVYYDPGINMKLKDGRWTAKKRNQFRIKWGDVPSIYDETEDFILS